MVTQAIYLDNRNGIINIVGMAIVDIVRRAEEKHIPIIMFIGLNSVLIPINFGLAHWMF